MTSDLKKLEARLAANQTAIKLIIELLVKDDIVTRKNWDAMIEELAASMEEKAEIQPQLVEVALWFRMFIGGFGPGEPVEPNLSVIPGGKQD